MNVIGIGGYARCGKDTFVSIAKQILTKNNYVPKRVAFADTLKNEVQLMLNLNSFPVDVYTTDTEAKSKVRPLLVWWGCARRDQSQDGLYWVNVVDKQLREHVAEFSRAGASTDHHVALVSDVRFRNEADWIHQHWNGEVIHLKRYSVHNSNSPAFDPATKTYGNAAPIKTFDPAPNEEELKNDPRVQEVANVNVCWESRGIPAGGVVTDDVYLQEQVLKALNSTKFFSGKLSL
jgi:hypothetical protein